MVSARAYSVQPSDISSLFSVLSLLSYSEKNSVGLWNYIAIRVCVRVRARACVCLCILPMVARKRFGKSTLVIARLRLGKNPLSLIGNGWVKISL
jgi:hypothetical protein